MAETSSARQERLELRLAIVTKMGDLATAGFGLVAALAWNAAIQALFRVWFGPTDGNWAPLFGYALTVTIVAVFVILWIGRIVGKLKPKLDST